MSEIVSLFSVFRLHLSVATLRQFCQIVFAVLAMPGSLTMRNISRWTSKGGVITQSNDFTTHFSLGADFFGCSLRHICWIPMMCICSPEMKRFYQNQEMQRMVYHVFFLLNHR